MDFQWLGGLQRCQNRWQIDPKSIKIKIPRWVPLGIDFGSLLIGFANQVGSKTRSEGDLKSTQKGIEQMMQQKGHLGAILGASWISKIHRRCWLQGLWGGFGWILGSKMEPSCDQNGIPNRFYIAKNRKPNKLIKANGFSMILEVQRVPKSMTNRSQIDQN